MVCFFDPTNTAQKQSIHYQRNKGNNEKPNSVDVRHRLLIIQLCLSSPSSSPTPQRHDMITPISFPFHHPILCFTRHPTLSTSMSSSKIPWRQTGHTARFFISQGVTHTEWNTCPHGSFFTSSPCFSVSRQIVQSGAFSTSLRRESRKKQQTRDCSWRERCPSASRCSPSSRTRSNTRSECWRWSEAGWSRRKAENEPKRNQELTMI